MVVKESRTGDTLRNFDYLIVCPGTGETPDQVVASCPCFEGDEVIARDEKGDPVIEGVNHTPRYLELVGKNTRKRSEADAD